MECATASTPRAALERRIDGIGWGLFLIAAGLIWLAPEDAVPNGAVMVALGSTLVGLSMVRWVVGLPVCGFLMILGVVLTVIGLSNAGVTIPLIPLTLLALGTGLVLRSFAARV